MIMQRHVRVPRLSTTLPYYWHLSVVAIQFMQIIQKAIPRLKRPLSPFILIPDDPFVIAIKG